MSYICIENMDWIFYDLYVRKHANLKSLTNLSDMKNK